MTRAFEQVTPTVRLAKGATGIGVVTHGDRALLVDSGLDENLVRKVANALANEGVQIAAVVNTHAHADHVGGNRFVAKRTGCLVAAPEFEAFFVERPDLEPYTLFGAAAPRALQGKFLQAEPSRVDRVLAHGREHELAGFRFATRALPGHTLGQAGIAIDGVLFVGDALLPEATLGKYGVAFAVDPAAALASAEELAAEPGVVVSYHGGVVGDVAAAVRSNAESMRAAEAAVLARLRRAPATAEEVLEEILDRFPPAALSLEVYALQAATVRGYLAALERDGRAEALLDGARLLWRLR